MRRERGEPERPQRRRGPGAKPVAEEKPKAARVPAPRAPQPRRDDAAPGRPQPSSKKRKRKRRS
jgi:hypothetical protein